VKVYTCSRDISVLLHKKVHSLPRHVFYLFRQQPSEGIMASSLKYYDGVLLNSCTFWDIAMRPIFGYKNNVGCTSVSGKIMKFNLY
jgi:hypothetical protein